MNDMKFNVGDRVIYKPYVGCFKTGTVIGVGDRNDIIPGDHNVVIVYDIKCDNGEMRWGYEDQFQTLI